MTMRSQRRKRQQRQCRAQLVAAAIALSSALPYAFVVVDLVEGWVYSPSFARQWHGQETSTPASYTYPGTSICKQRHTTLLFEELSGVDDDKQKHLEGDIAKRLSISKDRSSADLSQASSAQSTPRSAIGGSTVSASSSPSTRRNSRSNSNYRSSRDLFLPSTVRRSRQHNRDRKKVPQSRDSSDHNSGGYIQPRGQQEQANDSRSNSSTTSAVSTNISSSPSSSKYASLLPPPMKAYNSDSDGNGNDDPLSTGLSSWEEFLGVGLRYGGISSTSVSPRLRNNDDNTQPTTFANQRFNNSSSSRNRRPHRISNKQQQHQQQSNVDSIFESIVPDKLPSIQDLFPPDLASLSRTSASASSSLSTKTDSTTQSTSSPLPTSSPSPSSLDGVLPVSDLFYRSSSMLLPEDNYDDDFDHDDEELPFSAEQSDALSSDNNKIHIRRNLATTTTQQKLSHSAQQQPQPTVKSTAKSTASKKKSGRKMVRRGMEMLVGGVPINADPPQRSIELSYDIALFAEYAAAAKYNRGLNGVAVDWAKVILLNTPDLGPLLHTSNIKFVTDIERGLYCEHFCHSALKWDVCPKDLREIVRSHSKSKTATTPPRQQLLQEDSTTFIPVSTTNTSTTEVQKQQNKGAGEVHVQVLENKPEENDLSEAAVNCNEVPSSRTDTTDIPANDEEDDDDDEDFNGAFSAMVVRPRKRPEAPAPASSKKEELVNSHYDADDKIKTTAAVTKAKALGKEQQFLSANASESAGGGGSARVSSSTEKQFYDAVTELVFDISVSRAELESGGSGQRGEDTKGEVLKSVLTQAFRAVVLDEIRGFSVYVSKLGLTDKGDGTTALDVEFTISNDRAMSLPHLQRRLKRISTSFLQAVDDGVMKVAIASVAKLETRWSSEVRDRVVEECLFEDDDIEETNIDEPMISTSTESSATPEDTTTGSSLSDPTSLSPSKNPLHAKSSRELYVGGGRDGVFPDYSESNILNSPYRGEIGLRLVDAVVQRAQERLPRVIAIGDVHGCIDELQDLLRQCDYRPGDLVVFLGDLVCKGPDSISVVQMAREIGAVGVRGNHDFEVIRWHQAIISGVDPPVVGSEHFHIASCLTKADMKWLYTLPWYMSSKELGALFVHAGFVSGIRLAKQNPRLMMNMRSILPDGTVTSKFFNNWPWARLWDGPQTVLFGHDADRGLQQYEHAIGLDTGCVYGGRLTACILPEKRLVSVSARREYFKYRRKHYD